MTTLASSRGSRYHPSMAPHNAHRAADSRSIPPDGNIRKYIKFYPLDLFIYGVQRHAFYKYAAAACLVTLSFSVVLHIRGRRVELQIALDHLVHRRQEVLLCSNLSARSDSKHSSLSSHTS